VQPGGFIQRHPPDPADPASKPDANPLDDARTKWVDALPIGVRSSIDAIGNGLESKMRDLERLAAGGKSRAPKKLTAAERADPTAALESIRAQQGATWAVNRNKFMDYMAPSLGGDDGVKSYFSSLVSYGASELFVHPEVARRLKRVEEELKGLSLPMPQTSVGFSARGDHLHDKSKRKRKSPGMLAHAMGLAIDYFAYKNVHLTDPRLRAVLEAVSGRAPNMQLPEGALRTIVQSGEAKMGKGNVDETKWKEVEKKIGEEFDALVKASNDVEASLGSGAGSLREEVIERHRQLMAVRAERNRLRSAAKRARRKEKGAAEAAAAEAEARVAAVEAELKSQLPRLFGPWLDKITARINQLKARAQEQDVDLEQVSTDQSIRDLSGRAGKALKPGKRLLSQSSSRAKASVEAAVSVINRVDGNLEAIHAARVPRGTTEADTGQWLKELQTIRAEANVLLSQAMTVDRQASEVLGTRPLASPKPRELKVRRFKGPSDLTSLRKKLDGAQMSLTAAAESFAKGQSAAPEASGLAKELRERKARNAEIEAKVGKNAFQKLQTDKRDLFWLRQASQDLVTDLDFMFKDVSVKDPGAAQLLGGMDSEYGGGGFFGPTERSFGLTKDDRHYHESGFNRQFFQTMASYGFEIAATWTTSDAMHFELESLVSQIVPPDSAEADPAGAEARGKAFADTAVAARESLRHESGR
jgi:hypothetical protein